MKIFRFRAHGHSYGYIRANFFERRAIRRRIAAGDTGIKEAGYWPGPCGWGAEFVITAKKGKA